MASPALVGPKLDLGRQLLQYMDQTPVQPFAALWLWDSEAEEWQLVIGTDLVDQTGPSAALEHIQQVLREHWPGGPIELREVLVVERRDRRLEFLRSLPPSGRGGYAQPLRLERAAAGGQFVDDAWIYRNNLSGLVTPTVTVTDHSALVEWQSESTREVRVSSYKGDQLVDGPVPVQTMGRGLRPGFQKFVAL